MDYWLQILAALLENLSLVLGTHINDSRFRGYFFLASSGTNIYVTYTDIKAHTNSCTHMNENRTF